MDNKLVLLKSRMYDLLAAKQNIELEMQRVNQAIVEQDKKEKEPKEVETKDVPQS